MGIFRIGGQCYKQPWLGNVILTRFQLKNNTTASNRDLSVGHSSLHHNSTGDAAFRLRRFTLDFLVLVQ